MWRQSKSSLPGRVAADAARLRPIFVAQRGLVTPFAIPTSDFFRPNGPPAFESTKYAADYNEVKALGADDKSTRTPDQTKIALFWADGAGTVTPPGHWNVIAQDVVTTRRNTMRQNARLFALLNVAMADAAICAWDAKYHYNFWRPVTAIRNGGTDGNPATAADPNWSSLITTPHFRITSRAIVHSAAQPPQSCRSSMAGREFRSPPDRTPCPMLFGTSEASWTRHVRRRSAVCTADSLQIGERRWLRVRPSYRRVDVHAHHAAEVRPLSRIGVMAR
jgi:hypothetical protein